MIRNKRLFYSLLFLQSVERHSTMYNVKYAQLKNKMRFGFAHLIFSLPVFLYFLN